MAASLTIQGLNLISGMLLARSLGPDGRGELAAVILWPTALATISFYGFTDAVVFYISRFEHQAREVTATGLAAAMVGSVIIVAVGYPLLGAVLAHYGQSSVDAGRVYLAWVPINLITLVAVAVFCGRQEFVAFNVVRVLVIVTTVGSIMIFFQCHRLTMLNAVIGYLAANGLALLVAIGLLARGGLLGGRPRLHLLRPMLVYGVKAQLGKMSLYANQQADQAIIALFLPPTSLGLYAVGVSMSSGISLLGASLGVVALPAIGSMHSLARAQALFARFVRVGLATSCLAGSAVALLTPVLVRFFFGEAFKAAVPAAQILAVAAVFVSANAVLAACHNARNKPFVASAAELISLAVTVATLASLLPLLGILGAAIASLLAYATSTAYMLGAATRGVNLPTRAFIPSTTDARWIWDRFRSGSRSVLRR